MRISKAILFALVATFQGMTPVKAQAAESFAMPQAAEQTLFEHDTLKSDLTASVVAVVAGSSDFSGRTITIPAGSELTILGTMQDPEHGALVRIGLESDENGALPSDFWISADALAHADLAPVDMGDDSDLFGQIDDGDQLNSPNWSAHAGHHGGHHGGHHMTYCYAFVKEYLLKTGEVPVYLPGGSAWMAASILPHYGFHRVGGPESSAIGDVCVYSGGNGGNGHIEVKRAQGWWYGYGFRPQSILGYAAANHRLISCFRK